jgi:hypothetical protein
MKYMILKYVIGSALKLAFAYAARVVRRSIENMQATLNNGGISDDVRDRIVMSVKGLQAVLDLLDRFSAIIGTPELPLAGEMGDLADATKKLRKITDGL